MQKLFILKKVDNVNHLIGKLIQTDSGDFEIESLLKNEGSEVFGIPVLTDKGKNNERLVKWVASFLPPVGNDAFTQALLVKYGLPKFDSVTWPMTWLKVYKPDGKNTISFCESIPLNCVCHYNIELPFPMVDDADFDENYDDNRFENSSVDYFPEFDDPDYYVGYQAENYDDEYDEDYSDDEEYDNEPAVVNSPRSDSFPVYPENIPPEQPLTDAKAFAGRCDKFAVDDLRTIHNTFKALGKCRAVDWAGIQPSDEIAEDLQIPTEMLREITTNELVKQLGHLITAHCSVNNVYEYNVKRFIDLAVDLSCDLRSFAIAQKISI